MNTRKETKDVYTKMIQYKTHTSGGRGEKLRRPSKQPSKLRKKNGKQKRQFKQTYMSQVQKWEEKEEGETSKTECDSRAGKQ